MQRQRSVRDNWVNFLESRKVAVNKDVSCFKQSRAVETIRNAESGNGIITDKDEAEYTTKVSRKGREKIYT